MKARNIIILPSNNGNKKYIRNNNNGINEGLSRTLSQVITYPFEAKKIRLQVYGNNNGKISFKGIKQSSITSGIVYSIYYTIYNNLKVNPLASTIASVATSFIKIPISNCMRVLQLSNSKTNIIKCGKKIILTKGFSGLYIGYNLNIVEDIIEHNIRNNIYDIGKELINEPFLNMIIGCLGGSIAAGITTPFDTMKAKLINEKSKKNIFAIIQNISKKNGLHTLYYGCKIRTLSNATRFGMYYIFLEIINKISIF